MSRLSLYFSALVCSVLVLPTPLLAKGTTGQPYQPHYLTSVEEASNRVQFLSPHFIPMSVGHKVVDLALGYSLGSLNENRLGLNLSFTKSGVEQKTQYFWAWNGGYDAPVSTAYKSDMVVSIVYSKIGSFEIWNYPRRKAYPEAWCVTPVASGGSNGGRLLESSICLTSEADARGFADALATLTVAYGNTLGSASGVDVAQLQAQVASLAQKSAPSAASAPASAATPAQPVSGVRFGFQVRAATNADVAAFALASPRGIVVVGVDKDGLADKSGIQAGDVILEVNHSEINDLDLFRQFIQSGAAKAFRIWRKGQSIELNVPQSM